MAAGVYPHRASAMAVAALAAACLALACEPTVVIGSCAQSSTTDAGGVAGAAASSSGVEAVTVPWSTGFEDGLCGYASQGYCYARHGATLEIVQSPVHSGQFAAAFTVTGNATNTSEDRSQARCVRRGVMPKSASYGAWYFVPELHTSDTNWNLFHFLGVTETESHALWDISLANNADGELVLTVLDFLTGTHPRITGVPAIRVGTWVHIEIQLKRSAQADGEVIVTQDDVVALHLTNLITDDTDWGEWYVGNYARKLVPELSTVYVDDITMREEQ